MNSDDVMECLNCGRYPGDSSGQTSLFASSKEQRERAGSWAQWRLYIAVLAVIGFVLMAFLWVGLEFLGVSKNPTAAPASYNPQTAPTIVMPEIPAVKHKKPAEPAKKPSVPSHPVKHKAKPKPKAKPKHKHTPPKKHKKAARHSQ